MHFIICGCYSLLLLSVTWWLVFLILTRRINKMSKILSVVDKKYLTYVSNKDCYIQQLLSSHPDIYDHFADNLETDFLEYACISEIVEQLHAIETDDNSSEIACIIGFISVIDKVIDQYCKP